MTEILVAVITGGLSLIGVIASNRANFNKMQQEIRIHQAVTDTKIEELTREVREHNGFAQRMPVVENEIKHLTDEVKVLEGYHK